MSDILPSVPRFIDAAVLKPHLSRDEACHAIQLCVDVRVFTVCVRPWDIDAAVALCRGTESKVSTVVGFPHGTHAPSTKAAEAEDAIARGAEELDMVVNYGKVRSRLWPEVEEEISLVGGVCRSHAVPLKVIFETSQLTEDEIRRATGCAIAAGADFTKSSTGFTGEGATRATIQVMIDAAAGRIAVKASGGIRDTRTATDYLSMGVSRLGVGYSSVAAVCGVGATAANDEQGGY